MTTNSPCRVLLLAAAACACPGAHAAIEPVAGGGLTFGNTTPPFVALGLQKATGDFVHWGGHAVLSESNSWHGAGSPANGVCLFTALTQLVNSSQDPATFAVYLVGTPQSAPWQQVGSLTIPGRQLFSLNFRVYLSPGSYPLKLMVDPGSNGRPSAQAYEVGRVDVRLTDACAGKVPPETPAPSQALTPAPVLALTPAPTPSKSPTPTPPVKPIPAPLPAAELVSKSGMYLGGSASGAGSKAVPWGGTLTLKPQDAILSSNGRCAFNAVYSIANLGKAATAAGFANRIYSNSTLVSQQTNLSLAAGESRVVNTQMYLAPGTQALKLVLDADNTVSESVEANNTSTITVNVEGSCASPAPGAVAKR